MAPKIIDDLLVKPGKSPDLSKRDPGDTLGLADKAAGRAVVEDLVGDLDELQTTLWAENERSVLLLLQGMDASGKDGVVRKVLSGLNPQGTPVTSFKAPDAGQLEHDYLWRVHAQLPSRGQLGVFNRSHYEDVTAARLIGVVDHERCKKRYRHIVEFERMLADEGTTLVKVFLHISKDEQKERFEARLADPTKHWKFNVDDLETRKLWDEYQDAYEEVITETSTDYAPWFVVPADHKWVRDVAVATLLVDTLRRLDPKFPEGDPELSGVVID